MQNDVAHINKQIQKDTADIDYARRQAENQRMMADQKQQEGNSGAAEYYEHEADRFEQQATTLEDEIDQLQTDKERVEKRIAELEDQRTRVNADHTDRLAQIDKELASLRGSTLML